MKKYLTVNAINTAANNIQYASWAVKENDPKRKQEWIKEAIIYCDITKQWLEKSL